MADYKGNRELDSSVYFELTTNDATGARTDMSATPTQADFQVFKNGTLMTLDALSVIVTKIAATTGVYHVEVDTSVDADFTAGSNYQVLFYPNETVDSVSVAAWLGSFDIQNGYTGADLVSIGGTVQSATDLKKFADDGFDPSDNSVLINMSQSFPATPTAGTVGDALRQSSIESLPKKNTALADIPIYLIDSATKQGATGKTLTLQVLKDGGTWTTPAATWEEDGFGMYHLDATAADMNAGTIVFRVTATGCEPAVIAMSTVE